MRIESNESGTARRAVGRSKLRDSTASQRWEELAGQYTDIVSKYHLAMSQPVTCEFDGVTYASNGELPEEHRKEIIGLLREAREEMIAPIYVDLINNRNKFALLLGYNNFLEYSYAQEFNRDYTAEDPRMSRRCWTIFMSSARRCCKARQTVSAMLI